MSLSVVRVGLAPARAGFTAISHLPWAGGAPSKVSTPLRWRGVQRPIVRLMSVLEIAQRIKAEHGPSLDAFHRRVFDPSNLRTAKRPLTEEDPAEAGGPWNSIVNQRHLVTITASLSDLALAAEDAALHGFQMLFSIAGHDRRDSSRISLSDDERDAWLYAFAGPEQGRKSYHLGAKAERSGSPRTDYYASFFDEDRQPIPKPNQHPLPVSDPVDSQGFAN